MARDSLDKQKVTISLRQDLLRYADQRAAELGRSRSQIIGQAIAELRALTRRYRSVPLKGLPRFTGGAVGYVSYDAIHVVGRIVDEAVGNLE